MEKVKSFKRGRIWLNVYLDKSGELALTINKSFPSKEGGWKKTGVLKPRFNDLVNLVQVLGDFLEFDQENKATGWVQ